MAEREAITEVNCCECKIAKEKEAMYKCERCDGYVCAHHIMKYRGFIYCESCFDTLTGML